MPQAIAVDLGAHSLNNDIDEVVLKILCHPGYKSNADGCSQQQADAFEELRGCVFLIASGVLIDDMTENEWIQKGENLVDGCQEQRQCHQLPILSQVGEKQFHSARYSGIAGGESIAWDSRQ